MARSCPGADLQLIFDKSGKLNNKQTANILQELAKVTKANLAKVKEGMTTEEVFASLGRGIEEREDGTGKEKWVTWKDGDKVLVNIQFDPAGKVVKALAMDIQ